MCGNDPLHVDASPDGDKVAISFIRDCGATTGYSTHVSVVGASGILDNEPGNIFVVEGKRPVTVSWGADNHLVVGAGGSGKVFKKLDEFEGVTIEYR